MSREIKVNKLIVEKNVSPVSLEVTFSRSVKERHLEGFSEDQKEMIRLMANIFVKAVLNISEK